MIVVKISDMRAATDLIAHSFTLVKFAPIWNHILIFSPCVAPTRDGISCSLLADLCMTGDQHRLAEASLSQGFEYKW